MAKREDINQISSFGHADNVRKELDTKIDRKLSTEMFLWVVGGLVAIGIAVLSSVFSNIAELNSKVDNISKDIITLQATVNKKK